MTRDEKRRLVELVDRLQLRQNQIILLLSVHLQTLQRVGLAAGYFANASASRVDSSGSTVNVTQVAASTFPPPSLEAMLKVLLASQTYAG